MFQEYLAAVHRARTETENCWVALAVLLVRSWQLAGGGGDFLLAESLTYKRYSINVSSFYSPKSPSLLLISLKICLVKKDVFTSTHIFF